MKRKNISEGFSKCFKMLDEINLRFTTMTEEINRINLDVKESLKKANISLLRLEESRESLKKVQIRLTENNEKFRDYLGEFLHEQEKTYHYDRSKPVTPAKIITTSIKQEVCLYLKISQNYSNQEIVSAFNKKLKLEHPDYAKDNYNKKSFLELLHYYKLWKSQAA